MAEAEKPRWEDPFSPEGMREDCSSDLDAQAGALVRLGELLGVATPLHGFICHSLLLMEM